MEENSALWGNVNVMMKTAKANTLEPLKTVLAGGLGGKSAAVGAAHDERERECLPAQHAMLVRTHFFCVFCTPDAQHGGHIKHLGLTHTHMNLYTEVTNVDVRIVSRIRMLKRTRTGPMARQQLER